MQGFDPDTVLPEVQQPEAREVPQRQPRKDKAKRGERKDRSKDKPQQPQGEDQQNAAPAAEGEFADSDKPAGKRRRWRPARSKGDGQGSDAQPNATPRLVSLASPAAGPAGSGPPAAAQAGPEHRRSIAPRS